MCNWHHYPALVSKCFNLCSLRSNRSITGISRSARQLPCISCRRAWCQPTAQVWPVQHLEPGTGYVQPLAVVDTVVRLIRAGAASQSMQQLGVTGLAAVQLLSCFKDDLQVLYLVCACVRECREQARVHGNEKTSVAVELWLTQQHFIDHLTEVH